jgi:hypothetical protein
MAFVYQRHRQFSVTVPLRTPRLLYAQTLLMTPDQAVDSFRFANIYLTK